MRLFIDDERTTPPGYTDSARTVEEAIALLQEQMDLGGIVELVSFDYDAHSYKNWTFEAIAVWMKDNEFWPEEIRIHTLNSWQGRPWLETFFADNAPLDVKIDLADPHIIDTIIDGTAPQWCREFQEAQMK